MERFDLVQRAYNELTESGDIKFLPDGTPDMERRIEEQKAYLTRRSAYYLTTEHDSNIGLLSKTSGNNVMGLSVDIVTRKTDGTFWDIASDNGHQAVPIDAGAQQDSTFPSRWVQPTKELAGLPANGGNGGNGDNGGDDDEVMAKLDEMQGQIEAGLHKQDLMQDQLNQQTQLLVQAVELLKQILDKPVPPGSKFPITYPNYSGRVLGFTIVLQPEPRQNP